MPSGGEAPGIKKEEAGEVEVEVEEPAEDAEDGLWLVRAAPVALKLEAAGGPACC